MGPIFFGLVGFGLIALLFALTGRRGGGEPARVNAQPRYGRERLVELTRGLLTRTGSLVESIDEEEAGVTDFIARDPRPAFGQNLYVRVLSQAEPVDAVEVQSALDRLKGEGLHKALLISDSGFTDEARSAATDAPVELWDGAALARAVAEPARTPAVLEPRRA